MISIFDPKLGTQRNFALPDSTDLPLDSLMLINILIELQVMNEYLSEQIHGGHPDDPDSSRRDITSLT